MTDFGHMTVATAVACIEVHRHMSAVELDKGCMSAEPQKLASRDRWMDQLSVGLESVESIETLAVEAPVKGKKMCVRLPAHMATNMGCSRIQVVGHIADVEHIVVVAVLAIALRHRPAVHPISDRTLRQPVTVCSAFLPAFAA